jgi:DNA-directed RNA polymerase I subunit RPA43
LTYYPPFHGVVLAYNNPRLSEKPFGDDGKYTLMQCTDEYAVSWSWVTAEFMLFKPQRGTELDGYINLQNEGHLGVVCWNLFNASIPRDRLPRDWKWIGTEDMDGQGYAEEGAGYYVDGEGNKIEGMIKFRVKDIETSHDKERGFLSIEGTMLEESEEKGLLAKEAAKLSKDRGSIGRRLGGARALGATSLTAGVEPASQEETETRRHRLNY